MKLLNIKSITNKHIERTLKTYIKYPFPKEEELVKYESRLYKISDDSVQNLLKLGFSHREIFLVAKKVIETKTKILQKEYEASEVDQLNLLFDHPINEAREILKKRFILALEKHKK